MKCSKYTGKSIETESRLAATWAWRRRIKGITTKGYRMFLVMKMLWNRIVMMVA
jgi:hypothetical protein